MSLKQLRPDGPIFDLKDLNGYFKNNEKNTPKFIWKTWRNPGTLLVRNSGHPE